MKDKRRKKIQLPAPSQEELEAKAKAEEFWSDPCWTEPLDENAGVSRSPCRSQ